MIFLLLFFWTQDIATLSSDGAAAMRAGDFVAAEKAYRLLTKLDPANAGWRMNLGLTLHSAGRFSEAVPEFHAFLKANPKPGPIHLLLGLSLLKLEKGCDAIPPLQKAMAWNTAKARIELGDALSACGLHEKAAGVYAEAAASDPNNTKLARFAASQYWQARLYEKAKQQFAKAAIAYEKDANFQYEFGDTLTRLEGAEAGIQRLETAVNLDPALLAARAELGKAYLSLGRFRDAIGQLTAAAKANPELLLPLSRAYYGVGDRTRGVEIETEYRKHFQPK